MGPEEPKDQRSQSMSTFESGRRQTNAGEINFGTDVAADRCSDDDDGRT